MKVMISGIQALYLGLPKTCLSGWICNTDIGLVDHRRLKRQKRLAARRYGVKARR